MLFLFHPQFCCAEISLSSLMIAKHSKGPQTTIRLCGNCQFSCHNSTSLRTIGPPKSVLTSFVGDSNSMRQWLEKITRPMVTSELVPFATRSWRLRMKLELGVGIRILKRVFTILSQQGTSLQRGIIQFFRALS